MRVAYLDAFAGVSGDMLPGGSFSRHHDRKGALPSVVARRVSAAPTSVGYGAAFGGIAALIDMLNSCSPNIAVVNIDNGFGAACLAHSMLNVRVRK
jgi:pyridinium-3,5-biscarboxylic acid mononucleotide synthase